MLTIKLFPLGFDPDRHYDIPATSAAPAAPRGAFSSYRSYSSFAASEFRVYRSLKRRRQNRHSTERGRKSSSALRPGRPAQRPRRLAHSCLSSSYTGQGGSPRRRGRARRPREFPRVWHRTRGSGWPWRSILGMCKDGCPSRTP